MERVSQCVPQSTRIYDHSSYRVVFFSSAPIGIPFLKQLSQDKRFDLVGVVTMPDAPIGRGMRIQKNIIKQEAERMMQTHEWTPPVYDAWSITTPRSLRLDSKKYAADAQAFKQWATDLSPDLFVVIAYGHIMPQRVLDIPVFGSINVHGSLLPTYRGASPLQSVFLDRKTESGVTIMRMDAGVDTWDIIAYKRTHIPIHRTVIDLIDWIKEHVPSFLNTTLWEWAKWRLESFPQDASQATISRKFIKEDGCIDPFQDSFYDIWAKRQACALRPKLYFFHQNKRITITTLSLDSAVWSWEHIDTRPLIFRDQDVWKLHPACHEVYLTPEGKKSLSWEEFYHGYLEKEE